MKYTTYILINEKKSKTYVGHTKDINRRLMQHNAGLGVFTKKYRPWKVLYFEEFENENEAIDKERYYKSAAGRRFIKKDLF